MWTGGVGAPKAAKRVAWRRCENRRVASSFKVLLDGYPNGIISKVQSVNEVIGVNLETKFAEGMLKVLRLALGPENNIRILEVVIQLEVGDKVSLFHALVLAAGRPVPPADLRHGAVKEVAIVESSSKPGISL